MVGAGGLEKGKTEEAMEEKERQLIETCLAERYTIPAEVFSAGSVEDCARVSSLKGFELAIKKGCSSVYLMPYLPPRDAASIQQKVEAERLWLFVLNPELLVSKVSILNEIDEKILSLDSRLKQMLQEEDDDNRDKEDGDLLHFSDRQQEEEECFARGLAKFRRHQQNRLLFAHARQGNWTMTRKMLQQMYPKVYGIIPMEKPDNDGHEAILEQIDDIAHMFPYSEHGDIDEISCDLISILATEDWCEQKKVARSRSFLEVGSRDAYRAQLNAQLKLYQELCSEPSLLGAAEPLLAVTALKRQRDSLKSFAISKGHLGDKFYHGLLPGDCRLESFTKSGGGKIDELLKLVDQISVDYVAVKEKMQTLNESVAGISALKLKSKCGKFLKLCEKKKGVRCIKTLTQIKDEYIRVRYILQLLDELLKVIRYYEGKLTTAVE